MKKTIIKVLTVLLMISLVVGCSKKEEASFDNSTIEGQIASIISKELKEETNLLTVVENMLAEQDVVPLELMAMEVSVGYLNGFEGEITGFDKAVMFAPFMSQPFIGYLFETNDKESLKEKLDNQADLRWNICTEADNKAIVEIDDTHILFVMYPEEF